MACISQFTKLVCLPLHELSGGLAGEALGVHFRDAVFAEVTIMNTMLCPHSTAS